MPIIVSEPSAERGKRDARRHREKQKEVIRQRLPDIISEKSIIARRHGKTVKVPIRSLDIPHFRPKRAGQGAGAGVGQGPGQPGDVIGRRPGSGQQPGGAGQEPGVDYIETEVELEELIEMMLEDLGLPNLEQKTRADLEVVLGYKVRDIGHSGIWSLLHGGKTAKQGIKRFWAYLRFLERETGRDERTCFAALKQARGFPSEALILLSDPSFCAADDETVAAFPIIDTEDLRFWKPFEEKTRESNAVLIAMMDVSASMTTMKKYLARSMLFWLVALLRKIYTRVEVRFIIHHIEAKLVEEEDFFRTGESGGTLVYSALELANRLIEQEYPTTHWNVYPFHFSDGEDFDTKRSVEEARKLFEKGINMFGYGEIHVGGAGQQHMLLDAFLKHFPVTKVTQGKLELVVGKEQFPFLGAIIRGREDVWPALKEFLKRDRWLA